MTAEEWQAAVSLDDLAGCLKRPSERKLRLFACACCRRVWDWLTDETSRRAVQVAEWYADGEADQSMLDAIHDSAYEHALSICLDARDNFDTNAEYNAAIAAARAALCPLVPERVGSVAMWCAHALASVQASHAWESRAEPHLANEQFQEAIEIEVAIQARLFRDIFANPFRPPAFDLAWRTPITLSLAQAAYADMHRDRLAVLSDGLEEVGATGDILSLLRSPGIHVRGCWALDHILGKE